MKKILLFLVIFSSLMTYSGGLAYASDSERGGFYITPLLGAAYPTGNTSGTSHFTFGGEIGFHTRLGNLGAYVSHFSDSTSVNGASASLSMTPLLFSYTIPIGYFYLGGRAGVGFSSMSVSLPGFSGSLSGSSFAYGAVVGSRLPLSSKISFDIDVMWLGISQATMSGTLGTGTADAVKFIIPMAGLSFLF